MGLAVGELLWVSRSEMGIISLFKGFQRQLRESSFLPDENQSETSESDKIYKKTKWPSWREFSGAIMLG